MTTVNNYSERRRFKRYGISLGAILAFEELDSLHADKSISLQCIILDFCTHGLFLEIKKSTSVLAQLLHRKGKVLFSVVTDQGREYVQVDVQVMRVCSNGLGVAYEKISDSVFKALIKKANSLSKTEASSNPIKKPASSVHPEKFKTLFKTVLNENLPVLMDSFFKRALNDLEQAAIQAGSDDRTVFLTAARNLKLNEVFIKSNYCKLMLEEVSFIRKLEAENNAEALDGHTLSLIDKDDFEDWLNFSSSIRKVESQFNDRLNQFDLKLSYVTGVARSNINNPISPAELFENFKQCINTVEEIKTLKQTLYKVFEEVLKDNLDVIYQSLEKILEEYGAPGRIIEEIVKQPDTPSKNQSVNTPKQEVSQDVDRIVKRQIVQPELQAHETVGLPFSTATRQTLRARQSQPIAQTASRLLDIINQRDADGQQSLQANLVTTTDRNAYSPDEITVALQQLQAQEAVSNDIHQDSVTLQKQLMDTLSASNGDSKNFSAADNNRLEVYGQLFNTLMNDVMFTPHVKSYLEAIHLPLMALALKDSDFLDSENHPARSVLNQLSSLESAVKGNRIIKNQKIRETLDRLFARISQESMTNPEVFAIVDEELKEITRPVAKSAEVNIRRVIEAYEGKQKLENARQIIQREIDERIAGKLIPKVISTLLDAGWQHLLVITELNDENNANARQKFLKVIDKLMEWYSCQEPFTVQQNTEIHRVLALIENKLGSVCTNAFLHDKVMDELKATLIGTGDPRVRKPTEHIQMEVNEPESVDGGDIIENNWTRQVDRLQIGDWLTLSLESEEFEPLKLVWIGVKPFIYVFVNREGQKKLELSRDELVALMRSGAVNKIENLDMPLMDRAANMMLQKMHEKMVYNASHDPITHLINRRELIRLLNAEISSVYDFRHMLCYLEIIDFRMITNICGIIAGDELVKTINQLIKSQLDQDDILARLGDNTFGFLIKDCSDEEGYETARKLSEKIKKSHFEWQDKSYSVGVSIGLVPFIKNGYTSEEMLQQADSASITAKNTSHSPIRLFREDDVKIMAQSNLHYWAGRIDQILTDDRLYVRCQKIAPIEPAKTQESHYEVLLGIKNDAGDIISPTSFLPAVEHCRRMPEIDQWMINTVFNWIDQNNNEFEKIGGFAINLSGQSLNSEEFLQYLLKRLSVCNIPREKITFEVTETIASDNLVFTEKFVSDIKKFGCKFSLDDFGTGYSSYSYLKNLDVDYLKIDGSFIREIVDSPADVAMVRSMNEIAHSLGLRTIAEYVENDDIHAILKEIGVDYAQGWFIHKPVDLNALLH